MPTAIAITAIGTINAMPLRNTRHTINIGNAMTIRMLAITFAIPQVSLNARPMALIISQTKMIIVNNSSNSFSSS